MSKIVVHKLVYARRAVGYRFEVVNDDGSRISAFDVSRGNIKAFMNMLKGIEIETGDNVGCSLVGGKFTTSNEHNVVELLSISDAKSAINSIMGMCCYSELKDSLFGRYKKFIKDGDVAICNGYNVYKGGKWYPCSTKDIHLVDGTMVYSGDYAYEFSTSLEGWYVEVLDKGKKRYLELEAPFGYPVVSMENCFLDCKNLVESPKIPSGVKNLGCAFKNCVLLVISPVIPDTVVEMFETFSGCVSLIEVMNISESVRSLKETFFACAALKETPRLPDGIEEMESTFGDCDSLVTITNFPKHLRSMYGTFSYCVSLVNVPELPEGVEDIRYAFYNCESLKTAFKVPDSVIRVKSALHGCSSIGALPKLSYKVRDADYIIES